MYLYYGVRWKRLGRSGDDDGWMTDCHRLKKLLRMASRAGINISASLVMDEDHRYRSKLSLWGQAFDLPTLVPAYAGSTYAHLWAVLCWLQWAQLMQRDWTWVYASWSIGLFILEMVPANAESCGSPWARCRQVTWPFWMTSPWSLSWICRKAYWLRKLAPLCSVWDKTRVPICIWIFSRICKPLVGNMLPRRG